MTEERPTRPTRPHEWEPVTPPELRFNDGILEMRWHMAKDWGVRRWRRVESVTNGKPEDR